MFLSLFIFIFYSVGLNRELVLATAKTGKKSGEVLEKMQVNELDG